MRLILLVGIAVLMSACASAPTDINKVGEVEAAGYIFATGYLDKDELPDSLALLPAPPAQGSRQQQADEETYHKLHALVNDKRGKLAASDAELSFPAPAKAFSCAMNVPINAENTPDTYMLMRRVITDAGLSTSRAKHHYARTRPFVAMHESSCTPGDEDQLREDGSYPSGHAAAGWAWALVLAEVAPWRSDALLERGRQFGQSRAVCGMHWKSDIDAGRIMGAATVAKLHSNATFNAQLAAAKKEITALRGKHNLNASEICQTQKAVMQTTQAIAP